MKFYWFGINWHVFNQSEYRMYLIIQKISPQAKSGKYYQIWFFPRFGREKWRRSEHAHASYPGLFFRPPGFNPYMGRKERRVQGLDYWKLDTCTLWKKSIPVAQDLLVMDLEPRLPAWILIPNNGKRLPLKGTKKWSVQLGTSWPSQRCDCMVFHPLTLLASA